MPNVVVTMEVESLCGSADGDKHADLVVKRGATELHRERFTIADLKEKLSDPAAEKQDLVGLALAQVFLYGILDNAAATTPGQARTLLEGASITLSWTNP